MHITIGAARKAKDFRTELRMIKSGLLYADKVKICSMNTNFMFANKALDTYSRTRSMKEVREIFPEIYSNEEDLAEKLKVVKEYNRMRFLNKSLSKDGQKQFAKIGNTFNTVRRQLNDCIIDDNFIKEMTFARKKGLIELHPFSTYASEEATKEDFIRSVKEAITSGSTYPLLDDRTGELLRDSFITSQVSPTDIARSKHVGLAGYLFNKLPSIDHLSISEIVDFRSALSSPLVRFRSGMIEYGNEIQNAQWDEDFIRDAELLMVGKIEPIINEINDTIRSTSGLDALIHRVPNWQEVAGSASGSVVLATAVGCVSTLPIIASAAIGVVTAATILSIVNLVRAHQVQQEIEKNSLFFYYQLKQQTQE